MTAAPATTTFALAVTPQMSLAELQQTKAAWIAEGMTHFDALAEIIREFGYLKDAHTRRYTELAIGSIKAIYSAETTRYLVREQSYGVRETVVVWVGGLRVCCLTTGDDTDPSRHLFVPGKWLDVMLRHLPDAKDRVADRAKQAHQAEREKLAAELLIGKDV